MSSACLFSVMFISFCILKNCPNFLNENGTLEYFLFEKSICQDVIPRKNQFFELPSLNSSRDIIKLIFLHRHKIL